ncbi:MAG: metallophosphoesterase family protein [Bacteroides sp.]|nr:metallophosphoesterase family protein [Bacteroides sp.]MCM1548731.1 metallophosphoesterase family protein [Clostridium sp.]
MRILVLADVESKYYWDYFEKSKLDGIDLILSCGDLKPEYLSFLATFAKIPILYVRGNHDDIYETHPPEGCICIEDMIYSYQGIRILGLGGSIRYKQGKNQYTQAEMKSRVRKLRRQMKKSKGIDILLTHAPAYHVNDGEDRPHEGFEAFTQLLDTCRPKCFIHGHVHMNYSRSHKRESMYKDTRIINGFEKYVFDYI